MCSRVFFSEAVLNSIMLQKYVIFGIVIMQIMANGLRTGAQPECEEPLVTISKASCVL